MLRQPHSFPFWTRQIPSILLFSKRKSKVKRNRDHCRGVSYAQVKARGKWETFLFQSYGESNPRHMLKLFKRQGTSGIPSYSRVMESRIRDMCYCCSNHTGFNVDIFKW